MSTPRQEQTKDARFRAWVDLESAHGEILATLAGSVPFETGLWAAYWKLASAVATVERDRQNR